MLFLLIIVVAGHRAAPQRRLNASQPRLIRIEPMKAVDLAKTEPDRAIAIAGLFQRIVGEREGNIDLAHLDAVLAGIADDLRRGVKAHRLRVEQSAAERIGMVMFQPGRDIDELSKT